ncbi:hypothetical protein SAMN05216369_1462 [Marinobacter antarcticus]|uniref:Uncharacterized protein n=2 Tax=Marinobacter antarcticus TaxID=564117 RepID=A0A1M6REU2_9GAMM|nr:hypothetical protein SAMN05216369_1462 [Marinobacter antarcticus]
MLMPGEHESRHSRSFVMGTLLIILVILFLALIVILPLVEKYAPKGEERNYGNLTRFIFPLVALLIVIQMIWYYFF